MEKIAIVINGAGGVGKDTLCDLTAKSFKVHNISTIDPIKKIAKLCGWRGEKDDKARKFLSDLKSVSVAYNDYPTEWAYKQYKKFLKSENEVMFIHIREPEEIEKFVKKTKGAVKTLLVRGGCRMTKCNYGNASDDCVENYRYDYYYTNDKTLDVAQKEIVELINNMK